MFTKAESKKIGKWEQDVNDIIEAMREMIETKRETIEARREKHENRSEKWLDSDAGKEATEKLENDETKLSELEQVADDLETAIQQMPARDDD